MQATVPFIVRAEKLVDDSYMVSITKSPTTYRLREVLSYYGTIDPRHVGWIVSRLLNIACWFQYSEIAHYGLTVDNLYIHPAAHEIYTYGGWWYSYGLGEKLQAIPRTIIDSGEKSLYEDRWVKMRVNQALARLVGRELCGDVTGAKLLLDKNIPRPMAEFLIHPASEDAIEDYRRWREVLKKCFGPPKFIHMDITGDQVYGDGI